MQHHQVWRRLAGTLLVAMVVASMAAADQRASAQAIEVWSSDIHDRTDQRAGGGSAAITLQAARNGAFSGKVMVSAADAIEGLTAEVSDLRRDGSALPADAVRVRYGAPSDEGIVRDRNHNRPPGNDVLLDAPPQGQRQVPVWVTVRVPEDAAAGEYVAELTITTSSAEPVRVPLRVEVVDWTLPDTQDYRTWIEMLQSPDTLAMEYDVPLWSERHWEMIARSFELIGKTGSRVVYVPLICHTNLGNEESMVRWIDNGDGSFEHDYSVMERYLDLAEEHMGTPKMVVFWVWDVYMIPLEGEPEPSRDSKYARRQADFKRARWEMASHAPAVTMHGDDAADERAAQHLPPYDDARSAALWRPVWAGLRERMRRRGLEDAMMLGTSTDTKPTREQVATLHELTDGLPWASLSHHAHWLARDGGGRQAMQDIADIGYTAIALSFQHTINPTLGERRYAWKQDPLTTPVRYWRGPFFATSPYGAIRGEPEANLTGSQRGIARIGGDFWSVVKDRRGRRRGTIAAPTVYPQSHWRNLNIHAWMLAPGAEGAVPTARYMILREGIQEAEARIAIEAVLSDGSLRAQLPDDLIDRAQRLLDERLLAIWRARGASEEILAETGFMANYREFGAMTREWDADAGNQWFVNSGWADESGELFRAAGEVERLRRR